MQPLLILFSSNFHVHRSPLYMCTHREPTTFRPFGTFFSSTTLKHPKSQKQSIELNLLRGSAQTPYEMVIDALLPASLAVAGGLASSRLASRLTPQCPPAALVQRCSTLLRAARYLARPPHIYTRPVWVVREAITSSTFPEQRCTRVVTYRKQVRRNKTRGIPEAVRNRTTSRGPRNQKICVGS